MFSIDRALLPSLVTRKALLILDAQNDFLADDGALPVRMPIDLPQKLSDLANDFRKGGGEVIWVQSQFEKSRPVHDEQILTADNPSPLASPAPSRGRRLRMSPLAEVTAVSPEAFLTVEAGKGPHCVKPGAPGTEMHPVVKQAVAPNDRVLVKTFYSAFKVDELLRLLRVKFVTELFICGSSTNVGVMATAIEAASYGYTITIVEDCCGSQSMTRHRTAIRQITNTTGCDVLSAAMVLDTITAKSSTPERPGHSRIAAGGRSPTVRLQTGKKDAVTSSASDIVSSIERLSLSDKSAADDEHAPEIPPHKQPQPQRRSSSTLQPVAGSEHPQVEEQTDRDPVAATTQNPQSTLDSQIPVTPKQDPAETTDIDRHELVTPGKVVDAESSTADSTSLKTQSQQFTPPPSSSLEPPPDTNAEVSADKDLVSKCVESLEGLTIVDASVCPSSGESPTPTTTKERKKSITTTTPQASDVSESELCEGDTKVVHNILPEPLNHDIFERIKREVNWQRMSHQGGEVPRLVAVQGQVEADGSKPVYRHPADESPPLSPFTPTVDEIRRVIEAQLQHPLNHVLIQLYRHGNDYISEHSDKTLDIVRDSYIANVSLGAERTMTLRTKRQPKAAKSIDVTANQPQSETASADGLKRSIQRVRLPHNSLFQMGLKTNMRWMHAIRQNKRLASEKSEAELAYDGVRISLTFRRIGTFLDSEETRIWGQGATGKTRDVAHEVVNGQTAEAVNMLKAFGRENQAGEFEWEEYYGKGFDVLHITAAARLFLAGDRVVNLSVRILLEEVGVGYARGCLADGMVKFVDCDEGRTCVEGLRDVLVYLWKTYGASSTSPESSPTSTDSSPTQVDASADRFDEGLALLDKWRAASDVAVLKPWEKDVPDEGFLSGHEIGLLDFAVWPVLHFVFEGLDEGDGEEFPKLRAYYERVRAREGVARIVAGGRS